MTTIPFFLHGREPRAMRPRFQSHPRKEDEDADPHEDEDEDESDESGDGGDASSQTKPSDAEPDESASWRQYRATYSFPLV